METAGREHDCDCVCRVFTGESREEKTFRNWINSLGISPYVNHLYWYVITMIDLIRDHTYNQYLG